MKPWIGVDLDGTLAKYNGWEGIEDIGEVVWPMKELIIKWLDEGLDVKIFTARVAQDTPELKEKAIRVIQNWLIDNGIPALEVTNIKDHFMVELYDDRAVQVEFNTGVCYGESTLKYRRLLKEKS